MPEAADVALPPVGSRDRAVVGDPVGRDAAFGARNVDREVPLSVVGSMMQEAVRGAGGVLVDPHDVAEVVDPLGVGEDGSGDVDRGEARGITGALMDEAVVGRAGRRVLIVSHDGVGVVDAKGPRERRAGDVERHGRGHAPGRDRRALPGAVILFAHVVSVLRPTVVLIVIRRETPGGVPGRRTRPGRRGDHQHDAQHETEGDDSEHHLALSHLTASLDCAGSLGRPRALRLPATLGFTLRARTKTRHRCWDIVLRLHCFMMPPIGVRQSPVPPKCTGRHASGIYLSSDRSENFQESS